MCARGREGGRSGRATIWKEDGTEPAEDGDDAESKPGASPVGESVPMPRVGERACLGPDHAALHTRVLHANVGQTAGEPHRLQVPEKRTLGGHLGCVAYRLRASREATRTAARAEGLNGATSEPRERDRALPDGSRARTRFVSRRIRRSTGSSSASMTSRGVCSTGSKSAKKSLPITTRKSSRTFSMHRG